MRIIVPLLCVLAVLLCPHMCALQAAVPQSVVSDRQPACCEHCQKSRSSSTEQEQQPASPPPSENGRCCVCEGAVFDLTPRSVLDDLLSASHWYWHDTSTGVSAVDVSDRQFRCIDAPHPSPGREIRVAICSLLL